MYKDEASGETYVHQESTTTIDQPLSGVGSSECLLGIVYTPPSRVHAHGVRVPLHDTQLDPDLLCRCSSRHHNRIDRVYAVDGGAGGYVDTRI
jgi:hypothetical protein